MYEEISKEGISIILINDFKEIMKLFFGPFLVAFFIQQNPNSTYLISMYYFLAYFFASFLWLLSGWFANNKNKILLFKIGIIIECIYALMFVLLREKVLDHVILMSFIYGLTCATFFLPYNFLIGDKIKKKNRKNFELLKEGSVALIKIIVPILLGFMITITNYSLTTIVIVILTVMQFILTFNIKDIKEVKNDSYTPIKWFKENIKNKEIKYLFIGEYLKGLTINNGALTVIITIYILNSFKTNIALGYITSFSYAVSLVFAYFYNKYFKENDNNVIIVSSVLPALLTILIVVKPNTYLILLYNLLYYSFVTILLICSNARIWNKSESKDVKKTDRVEYWVIRDLLLNLGRITSFVLLFIFSLLAGKITLGIYTILLSLSLIFVGLFSIKITE